MRPVELSKNEVASVSDAEIDALEEESQMSYGEELEDINVVGEDSEEEEIIASSSQKRGQDETVEEILVDEPNVHESTIQETLSEDQAFRDSTGTNLLQSCI